MGRRRNVDAQPPVPRAQLPDGQRKCSKDWCIALALPGRVECVVHVRGLVPFPLKPSPNRRRWANRESGWYRPPRLFATPWDSNPTWPGARP